MKLLLEIIIDTVKSEYHENNTKIKLIHDLHLKLSKIYAKSPFIMNKNTKNSNNFSLNIQN